MNDSVKIKVRTPDYLYTYKTNEDEATDLLKSAKDIEIIEYGSAKGKKASEEKETSENEESKEGRGKTPEKEEKIFAR